MSVIRNISDEQLNAYIDNQLDTNERAFVLMAIKSDKEVEEKYNRLSQVKEMVSLAYNKVPEPPQKVTISNPHSNNVWKLSVAASLLLIVGVVVGTVFSQRQNHDPSDSFLMVNQLEVASLSNQKVLIHISTMEKQKVEAALQKAEQLLSEYKKQNKVLDLEVIANAQGLGILRDKSSYSGKISSLTNEYSNVSFLACGIAKENARLKEGHEIKLLPQATQVPAALDQILKRIKFGWLYVKA